MFLEARLQRLAELGIWILFAIEIQNHFVLERDGFAALVERTPEGFGHAGGAGLLTERGLATLVWRDASAFFVLKGSEQPASTAQVEALRRFSADLESALR
jgi:hypothetical protein